MAGLYDHPEGALTKRPLSASERRKLQAAMLKMDVQAASGGAFGAPAAAQGALAGANVRQNPGTEMGPAQNVSGMDVAKQAMIGLGGGFGFGPLSVATMGRYALNPSTFANMGPVNISGLGTVTTNPGPLGPMMDMTGFGALARAAGRLNAANLQRIAATDPKATFAGGRGWAGAFSNGTFSGTLPGGLEAATRRGMIRSIADAHYDRERDRYGRDPGKDPRQGGGSRPEGGMGRRV